MTRRSMFLLRGIAIPVLGSLAAAGIARPGEIPAAQPPAPAAPTIPRPPEGAEADAHPPPSSEALPGVVVAHASVDLAPRHEGRLRAIHVRLGDRVEQGAVLATLDVPSIRFELAMAEAAMKAAEAERERAMIEQAAAMDRLARRQALSADALATQEELSNAGFQHKLAAARLDAIRAQIAERRARIDQLRQAKADLEIRAPFAGVIAARYIDAGVNVSPASPVLRLIGGGDVFIRFAIPPERAAGVTPGTHVRLIIGAARHIVGGTVEKVAPEIDVASRMTIAEARMNSAAINGGALIAGEAVRVLLSSTEAGNP